MRGTLSLYVMDTSKTNVPKGAVVKADGRPVN
jgi:hypothetical protein